MLHLFILLFFLCSYPQSTLLYKDVKRSMFRYRNRVLPTNVANVTEILTAYSNEEIMQNYGVTTNGERFFKAAFTCDEFEYCIFASDAVIAGIQDRIPVERRSYLMDATFKICPYGTFNQILIIYACYLDTVK